MLALFAEAAHGHEPFLLDLQGLLCNPAHWAFEAVSGAVYFALLTWPAKKVGQAWLRRHDHKHHHGSQPPCPECGAHR